MAEERLQKILMKLTKVLSETASRRKYDRMWYNHIGKQKGEI